MFEFDDTNDSPSTALVRADLADALQAFEQAIDDLADAIRADRERPAWGWKMTNGTEAREEALRMIRLVDYQEGQDPSETSIYPALLGASANTLAAATRLNAHKDRLKAVLNRMRGLRILIDDPERGVIKIDLLRHALAQLGRPRLNYQQATRKLVVCRLPPYRVGFSWVSGSARVSRTDRETLIDRLQRKIERFGDADPGLLQDLETLQQLPAGEVLAHYRDGLVHPRVNLAFETLDGTRRLLKTAVMPVLYPAEPEDELPQLRPLSQYPPERGWRRWRRTRGSKHRVDPERLLITMPIHRYDPPRLATDDAA